MCDGQAGNWVDRLQLDEQSRHLALPDDLPLEAHGQNTHYRDKQLR